MKTAIIKNVFMAMVVLAMAMMVSCDLAVPAETGRSVEVVLGGLEGAGGARSAFTGDSAVEWIKIRVMDSTGIQVGQGTLVRESGTLAFKTKLTGLPNGTLDFMVWAGKTVSSLDTVLYFGGTQSIISTSTSVTVTVATATGGRKGPATDGIIFYVTKPAPADNTGWTYLEAAPSDDGTTMAWSNITSTAVGSTGTAIGTGQANTTAIVGQSGCTSGAAWTCDAKTYGGYSDWFLPSKDELNAMCGKKVAIGGFASDWYWSSSEKDFLNAWVQNFSDGSQGNGGKGLKARVRAVRSF